MQPNVYIHADCEVMKNRKKSAKGKKRFSKKEG